MENGRRRDEPCGMCRVLAIYEENFSRPSSHARTSSASANPATAKTSTVRRQKTKSTPSLSKIHGQPKGQERGDDQDEAQEP